MKELTLQKFKLALNSLKDFLTNLEQQEIYAIVSQKVEAKEMTEVEAEAELERLIVEEFKSLPEQFTLDELKSFYEAYEENIDKFDFSYISFRIFNMIFAPFLEKKDSHFFQEFMLTHDFGADAIVVSDLIAKIKPYITEERIRQLLLTYKENSEVYKLHNLLTNITITNKLINFIFENGIEIYLNPDLYNSLIAQVPDISFEQKLEYLQRMPMITYSEFDNSPTNDLLFSTIMSIIPSDYPLDQVLEIPIIKENLHSSEDLGNLLGCYKFKDAETLINKLLTSNLMSKIDLTTFNMIINGQNFSVEEFKKLFLDPKNPFTLSELINIGSLSDLMVLNSFSLTEKLEILTDERIFPGGLNDDIAYDLISNNITSSDLIVIVDNPILSNVLITNYKILYYKVQAQLEFSKEVVLLGGTDYGLASKILTLFTKENFAKILSDVPSVRFSIDEKYERFLKLSEEIPDILSSLNLAVFSDETFALGYDFAKLISMYKELSNFYEMAIDKNNYVSSISFREIFSRIWAIIEKDSQEFKLDSKELLYYVLLTNSRFFMNFNFDNISTNELSKLIYFMIRNADNIKGNIIPNITDVSDLINYENDLAKICDEQYINAQTLEEKINIYFNKYFNMSMSRAKGIYELFGNSNEELIPELKEYLDKISFALNITKLDVLDDIYANERMYNLKETFIFESFLKRSYSASLRRGIDEHSPLKSPITTQEYDGKTLRIHHPLEDFCMLVHSTDAYGKLELLNNNYYDSWNKSSRIRNHGICCSFVGHDNLGIAEVKDVLLGFSGWDDGAIPHMAPYDLYTTNDEALIKASRPSKFMNYRELIDNTRHTHNEVSLERYQDIPTAQAGKIQPSYIIIFEDMSEELKQKAYKAAIEFGIDGEPLPIICLDKKLIAEHESQKIDSMIQEFRQTGDVEQLAAIICKHENNRSGYRITNPEFLEGNTSFFPSEKIITLIEETFNYYSSELSSGTISIQEYWSKVSEILSVLDNEEEKFAITNETGHRINNIDLPVREWRNKVERNVLDSLNISLENRVCLIQKFILAPKNDDEVSRVFGMINIDAVTDSIDIVKSQGVYEALGKNHNFSHIERVLLFADLLANKEKLSDREREMLMVSATYHDCGRENDTEDKNHAKRSVSKISDLLGNFNETEQKMIKIAIEFHEEKQEFVLDNLCLQAGLSKEEIKTTKKIAFLLKDADALDRTRFRNAATLDPKRLRTSSAKGMVEFAKKLQKMYQDLPTYLIEQKLTDEIHYVNR